MRNNYIGINRGPWVGHIIIEEDLQVGLFQEANNGIIIIEEKNNITKNEKARKWDHEWWEAARWRDQFQRLTVSSDQTVQVKFPIPIILFRRWHDADEIWSYETGSDRKTLDQNQYGTRVVANMNGEKGPGVETVSRFSKSRCKTNYLLRNRT